VKSYVSPSTTAACGVPEIAGALAVVVLEELEVPLVDELVLAVDPADEKGPELSLPQAASSSARPEAKIARQTRRADPTENEVMPCNALPSAQLKPMQKGQTQQNCVSMTVTVALRRDRQPRYLIPSENRKA
jgi:hypothetical protein